MRVCNESNHTARFRSTYSLSVAQRCTFNPKRCDDGELFDILVSNGVIRKNEKKQQRQAYSSMISGENDESRKKFTPYNNILNGVLIEEN